MSQLIKKKLRSETAGKPVSEATIKMTSNTLSAAIMRLWAMGFHLQSVSQLRSRHCKALAEDWLREGYSVNTIVNNLCRLRRLGHWIGRDDLVPNNAAAIWLNVKRPKPGSSRAKVEIVAAVQDLKQHAPAR
ncbi:phage integrase N-terminal domain-containing protein [Hydrogenophaga sp. NFH-34]|uniref:phage integrase N-terminal domain-containing protein n=1 Tax=Hydrogenophaga sp. NFH-34 TaxID=2744446 RepID=UPI001F1B2E1B|nr:phage integrase N-terminal domain-containing protein [Hydrogenophaga sp. NFH-34]